MEVTPGVTKRMQAARDRALAAGCSPEAIASVAPIYEDLWVTSIEVTEYRVAAEVWTLHGWSIYHAVPLTSHEVETLPAIMAHLSRRSRPKDPEVGDYGRSWMEVRVASRWSRYVAEDSPEPQELAATAWEPERFQR